MWIVKCAIIHYLIVIASVPIVANVMAVNVHCLMQLLEVNYFLKNDQILNEFKDKKIHLYFLLFIYYVNMKEDFAEYTKCVGCNASLLLCDCNCPKCGKRENCKCNLIPIKQSDVGW